MSATGLGRDTGHGSVKHLGVLKNSNSYRGTRSAPALVISHQRPHVFGPRDQTQSSDFDARVS